MTNQPLVSCIMPTHDRRRFVGQAISYFLRQDYQPRELIIVDDGARPVADLVPEDDRIRYLRLEQRTPLGAKRNLAGGAARGELIAHWDDDDWMAPERLSIQVAALLASGAEICGAPSLRYYRPAAGDAWLYRPAPGSAPAPVGCTLLYRRSALQARPFPPLNVGEDWAFVRGFPAERICAVDSDAWYVAILHGGNTAAKNLSDPRWERRALSEVTGVLAGDRDFYVELRTGGQRPAPRRAPCDVITLGAPFAVSSSYGSLAEYLALGLARAGAAVNLVPLSYNPAGMSDEFQALLRRSRPGPGDLALYFCWPRPDLARFRSAGELFINTMWESSRLPAAWLEELSRARALIVPTRFVADVCRASGVSVPIEVVPEGIDPAVYHYEERPERPGLTTLIVGPVDERKNTALGIAAWKRAFAGDPAARLIIKTQYRYGNYRPDDPRISYVEQDEPTRGIAHWYRRADVLLALGNEGFGLPLVEAMATGLPAVALDAEGQADVCADAGKLVLRVPAAGWRPYSSPAYGPCGVRAVPDVEAVAARLRWVAEQRDEAAALGRAAADWAAAERNIWRKGPAVLDVLERHLQPPRPLRRAPALWVPSWHSVCGVAEYSAHLAAALPQLRASAAAPDLRGARVLHVQHEHSLFGDRQLGEGLRAARRAGVPVAITEHTVLPQGLAWEQEADALVALTARGAGALRARLPGARVEWIPPGCPRPATRRRARRGRVIGAFGFLSPHKGFWRLLETLRALPGSELLLLSHARSPALEEQWERAAAGLPVRRVGRFLGVDEAIELLASEADALAYWYDEIPHSSASYAVRVGLASGAPVLTSPTSWFADLRAVTYQPPDLTEGVRRLLDDDALRDSLSAAAAEHCRAHAWPRIAERHLALWQALER